MIKLTSKNEAAISTYVDKWINVGLDCSRIDPDAAKNAVINMYINAELEPPCKIIFANGPLHMYNLYLQYVKGNLNDFISNVIFGQHESHWIGFYDFFKNEVGVSKIEKIQYLIDVAKNCGWVYCGDDIAIIMDRPLFIKLDENKRLHNENGPAIKYMDGFAIYSWHGTKIPKEWIEDKDNFTPEMAFAVENVELRRVAFEIIGWNNILKKLECKVIDEDEDPMIGTLLETTLPDFGTVRFIRVLCGTGRTFAIPVPPTVKTALEANAWTYNIEPNFLRNLEVRT